MTGKFKFIAIIFTLFITGSIFSQSPSYEFSKEEIIERLKKDIETLASEEFEGREAGTPGEELTVEYIKERFKNISVKPLFDGSYFQNFEFHGAWSYAEDNTLQIGDIKYEPGEDFFPMVASGDTSATQKPVYVEYGFKDEEFQWNDYENLDNLEGKIFVMEYFLPDALYEKLEITTNVAIQEKVAIAIEKGAGGIIFVNTLRPEDDPHISLRRRTERHETPIAFAGINVYKHLEEQEFNEEVTLSVELTRDTHTGTNVAGYIDNDAATTVVIGGHHDHLGYGGLSSRHQGEQKIHYGADDNASGVAGVFEAARYIKEQDWDGNNYLFITFSAEEKGLLGSRHFTESGEYDMDRVNYMFNYDMIGRMEDENLVLIGTGTSPTWEEIITETKPEHFNIRMVSSGMGGSDHTAFYLQDIPVIFFFTGIHDDYHAPGDTPNKINYEGQKKILKLSWELIEQLDQQERLEFTETPVDESRRRRPEVVTLGIMPDHAYDDKDGLKVQKVMEDEPAYKGGIKDEDIIISLNDKDITDIHSYMQALENFEEGDKVTITLMREKEEVEVEVEF